METKNYNKKDIKLIKRALKYIIAYKYKLILAFLCIILGIGCSLVQPFVWGNLITALFNKKFDKVIVNIVYISSMYVFQTFIVFLQSYLFISLNNNIICDLKLDMYKKILNLPVKAFDEMRIGDFLSRLQGDTAAIANILTNQLVNSIVDIIKIIGIGIIIFTISLPLSIIVVVSFPISYYIFSKSGKILRCKNKEVMTLNDNYFSTLQQSLLGIKEIKSLGIKENNFKLFTKVTKKLRDKSVRLGALNIVAKTIAQSVNFISQIVVMSFGGYLIFKDLLTMQYYIAFSSYVSQVSSSLINITQLNSNIQQVLISLERIFELMDNLNYKEDCFGEKNIDTIKGNIKFKNVSFQYNSTSLVLKNISFNISENQITAIIGTSGSGKTTILNLLLRFYQPIDGRILIDDIDVSDYSEECLRKHVSIVRQEPFLFNASIKDNLLTANPLATEEELYTACKDAFIHDFIMKLPDKYDSMIGENSVNLSGGQKQRLSIARALLKNSKVILFDEATSSLDNESQYYIKKAINKLAQSHTIIIIAHRLFNVIEANQIIVIDDGKLVGLGKHDLLIENNPIYRCLYEAEINLLKN